LINLAKRHGSCHWQVIANSMPGRTARQCRDRFVNYLTPNLSQDPWSSEEDQVLIDCFKQVGPHWSQIALFLPGRSSNAIKNRWYTHLQRRPVKRDVAIPPVPGPAPDIHAPTVRIFHRIQGNTASPSIASTCSFLSMLLNP
jgi:hypothetical protein